MENSHQRNEDGNGSATDFDPFFCRFSGGLFHLLPRELSFFSLSDRIRLLLRAVKGFEIFYCKDGTCTAAYCFVKQNYLGKYHFMEKRDALINPYFVFPEYRGRGIGTRLLKRVLSDESMAGRNVWAVVKEDNLPSLKALQKAGFVPGGFARKTGWSYELTEKPGHLIVMKTRGGEKENEPR